MFTIKPVEIATTKMAITNEITNFFLNSFDNNTTSGILAPAPPMIKATTVPSDIPFEANASAIGTNIHRNTYNRSNKYGYNATSTRIFSNKCFGYKSIYERSNKYTNK